MIQALSVKTSGGIVGLNGERCSREKEHAAFGSFYESSDNRVWERWQVIGEKLAPGSGNLAFIHTSSEGSHSRVLLIHFKNPLTLGELNHEF